MSDLATVRPDDSTAIALLKEHIAGLQHQLEVANRERDEFRDALEVVGDERDELSQQIAAPDAQANRIKELEGQIRTGKHRDTFAALAKKTGVREEALADLFDTMRAKAAEFDLDPKHFEADSPDAKVYEAALAKARESRPYAFTPDDAPAGDGDKSGSAWPDSARFRANQTPPVVGSGRGPRNNGSDGTIITPEMRADPTFMLNPANRETIALAAREHRIR